jgi:hypothetical protein
VPLDVFSITWGLEYSSEKMVKSPNPFCKAKIPLQYGIDIRMDDNGHMLPGGKNTFLFHQENFEMNKKHKMLGVKFEQAGFPDIN